MVFRNQYGYYKNIHRTKGSIKKCLILFWYYLWFYILITALFHEQIHEGNKSFHWIFVLNKIRILIFSKWKYNIYSYWFSILAILENQCKTSWCLSTYKKDWEIAFFIFWPFSEKYEKHNFSGKRISLKLEEIRIKISMSKKIIS